MKSDEETNLAAQWEERLREKRKWREEIKLRRMRSEGIVLRLLDAKGEILKATVVYPKWSAQELIRMAQSDIPLRKYMKLMDRKPTVTIHRIRKPKP